MDMGCRPIGVTGFSCFLIIIVANQWVVLLYFFKDLFVSLVERVRVCAREHKSRGKEGVREREKTGYSKAFGLSAQMDFPLID